MWMTHHITNPPWFLETAPVFIYDLNGGQEAFYGVVPCLSHNFITPLSGRGLIWGLTTGKEYKISLTQALGKMKNVLVSLFSRKPIKKLIASLHNIFFKSLTSAVPDRKYPRCGRGKGGVKKQIWSMGYK